MRTDFAILCVSGVVFVALLLVLFQYVRNEWGEGEGGVSEEDEFASPGDEMAQFSCNEDSNSKNSNNNGITTRDIFSHTSRLAATLGKNGITSTSRRDLLAWRTHRNTNLRKRPGATDNAAFDSLRPAFDSMCRAVERQSECFRPIGSSSSASSSSSSSSSDSKISSSSSDSSSSMNAATTPAWATALRKQVRLWSPSTSAFMQRPTLMCVSLVFDAERVENALEQWKLWGKNCDDFYIAVQLPTADATTVHNATTDKRVMQARLARLFRKYDLPLSRLWVVRPLVSWKIQDPVRYDRWQAFRELSRVMGDEELSHALYHTEYTLFVRDDTYVIPENVFGFLSSPEARHIDNLGGPVMMGHVLQVPSSYHQHHHNKDDSSKTGGGEVEEYYNNDDEDDEEGEDNNRHHDDHHDSNNNNNNNDKSAPKSRKNEQPHQDGEDPKKKQKQQELLQQYEDGTPRRIFASFDGGLLWNRIARKLFMNAIRSQDTCAYANTEADDVMLGDCFRFYGITPIDTADARGSDRQHILRPEWAMTVGKDPKLVEWYSLFRGRPSLQGAAAISPSSMTFGGLHSIEELQQMHRVLSD